MRLERSLTVTNKYGLHARASTLLANTAGLFSAEVRLVSHESAESVDAKSIIEVMSLGAEKGHELKLEVDGSDAPAALDALIALFERKFDED